MCRRVTEICPCVSAIRGCIPVFLEPVPTGGADRHARIKQARWFCSYSVVYFLSQRDLCCMAQAQLDHGGGTLQRVAGARVSLAHLWAADRDLLNHDAPLVVHEASLPPAFL